MDLNNATPSELSEEYLKLTDIYCKSGELLVRLIRLHADYYESFRPDHKSDAGLESAWNRTVDGLAMLELKQKIKNIEKKMSAIKFSERIKNNEVRNQW